MREGYRTPRILSKRNRRKPRMKTWIRPDFQEVNLACEINCYAPAER
ncbi:pyrroloquinoline quinone precursor peptide PqqA [Edaphobacter sp. HDX4]